MFYFIRHGEPDDSQRNSGIYQGFGVNLAGLSERGIAQIQAAARDPRLSGADIILCSPYTRAVQTAAILSKELGADLKIETDLHEWLANQSYVYVNDEAAGRAHQEYLACGGTHSSEAQEWEEMSSVRRRVLRVLERYAAYQKVLVACHGIAIQAVTGGSHPDHSEIRSFDLRTCQNQKPGRMSQSEI
jgi:broad specificity phosphatase PhoE